MTRWSAHGHYMTGYPPSSPSMGLFKDGQLVFMLQRTDLQQMDEDQVSAALRKAFDEHCTKPGPSIDAETFQQIRPYRGCGSQIPLMSGALARPDRSAAPRPAATTARRACLRGNAGGDSSPPAPRAPAPVSGKLAERRGLQP